MLSWLYNKLFLFHLVPGISGATIQLYEVDPNFSQRVPGYIPLKTFNGQNQLMQMQVVDSLLVVHNLDEHSSQIFDIKVNTAEWNLGLLKDGVGVDPTKATAGKYLMEFIEKDEEKTKDFAYKFFS
jgi:hypothetical protein